jgi:SAM-dependent methyltransferase
LRPERTDRWHHCFVTWDPSVLRLTFGKVADAYHQVRPTYPTDLFDELFALLPDNPRILEVGPGTGQATSELLRRGAAVDAIEISAGMADKLRAVLPSEALCVTVGDFEVEPKAGSYDCVFCACAYHWIGKSAQRDRPAALLGPRGVLAIVDLTQVDAPEDRGFFAAVQPIYDRYGQGKPPELIYPAIESDVAPKRDNVRPLLYSALLGDERFGDVQLWRRDWDQTYSADRYRQLMSTYSGTQVMEPGVRTAILDDVEAVVREDFGGEVTRPLVVSLITALLAPS